MTSILSWWRKLNGPNGRTMLGTFLVLIGIRQLVSVVDETTERHSATVDRAQALVDRLDQELADQASGADPVPVDGPQADPVPTAN